MESADLDLDASELKSRAERRVGQLLRDKWRIDALLGLGGMAAVYAATHRNGKRGAVKILHAEAAMVPDIRARFLREGYLSNNVGHPGAVSILDDDVDVDGTVFLVMELLEGHTLEAAREAGSVAWAELLVIAHRVLDVLAAAHEKSIVHRDLKPANVFVCSDGAVKILDFGIARLHSVQPSSGGTGRDTALGTPGYMPPEQARGRWDAVDGQSDLWSLGATLFAVLGGRPVHQAPTLNEQLLAAMTLPAPPLLSVAPDAPVEVADLVDRALRFDKADRFANARAMQREVARVHEALTGKSIALPATQRSSLHPRSAMPDAPTLAATQQPIPSTDPKPARRVPPLVTAAIGIGAVVLLGLIGFYLRSGASPTAAGEASSSSPLAPASTTAPSLEPAAPSEPATASASSTSSLAPLPSADAAPASAEVRAAPRRAASARPGAPTAIKPTPSPSPKLESDPFGRRK